MSEADNILRRFETCYAYNTTFKYYHKQRMIRADCEEFVNRHNECKGGQWEIRRVVDCQEHFELLKHKICVEDSSDG